jgi:adenylate cyclase
VEKRPYVASEVPFIPYWRQAPLEDYATAEDFKALALNVRGWYGIATRHVDVDSARRDALDECEALVAREVPVRREYDRCMLYAVGNDVVWSFRPPPMPPAPFVPAQKLSPPVAMNPATIPLIGDIARRNLTEHYLTANHSRAFVLGHGHFNWWTPNDNEADAIRRNLQMCGHITGRPCVIYAVDNNVIVRVPRLHRIVNVFTPEDIVEADPTQDEALERYLIANDWRALAVSDNRRIGIAFGRADEAGAVKDAMGDCIKAGGTGCTIKAVGPFLVEPL